MTTQFKLLKNGKIDSTVFANPTTKQIVEANRNSFGYNISVGTDKEFDALCDANNVKRNQGKSNYSNWSYSKKSVEALGFVFVKRGELPLW